MKVGRITQLSGHGPYPPSSLTNVVSIADLQAAIRRLRKALEHYKNCRHACIDCPCTKEAREALE